MTPTDQFQRHVLLSASKIGLGQPLMDVYDGLVGLPSLSHLKALDDRIREFELPPEDVDGHVLLPLIPGSSVDNYRSCLLGHAYRTRGYEPLPLIAPNHLDACLAEKPDDSGPVVRELCVAEARKTVRAFGMEPITVSALRGDEGRPAVPNDPESSVYRGVDVGRLAMATTRMYFDHHAPDIDDPTVREVFERYLTSAMRLTDACEAAVERYNVVTTIVAKDVYVGGGVPLQVVENHGIPGYSQEIGYRDGTLVFGRGNNRNTQPFFSDQNFLEAVMREPLTEHQRATTVEIMDARLQGGGTYNYSAKTTRSVDVDRETVLIGAFTNLIWDMSLEVYSGEGAYNDPLQWVTDAIDCLGRREGVSLVVKTHPAERVFGTGDSVVNYLNEQYDSLPDNVQVLPPDTQVSTYQLVKDLDLCLVFNTMVGLEAAYIGQPVLVTGDTHYRKLGFTHDPNSVSEYQDLLTRAVNGKLATPSDSRELAIRYAHYLFCRKCLDFPFYVTDRTAGVLSPTPADHDDLAPGNPTFDMLVERTVAGKPVVTETNETGSVASRVDERND